MKVYLKDNTNSLTKDQKRSYTKLTRIILRRLKVNSNKELCITFVNDETMREYNSLYRDIRKTTDVLSFAQDGPDITILGDIIISAETAKRRSKGYRIEFDAEIVNLIIHGILHLLGYDHKHNKEAILMRKKERELLSNLNSL